MRNVHNAMRMSDTKNIHTIQYTFTSSLRILTAAFTKKRSMSRMSYIRIECLVNFYLIVVRSHQMRPNSALNVCIILPVVTLLLYTLFATSFMGK